MELNTYHWIGLVAIGTGLFLWGGSWLWAVIERAWNQRKRDRLRW